ncbi:MAG: CBS domain-containing protein [Nanoarchaeota archaeon]|nr:CBS domain-containing protein [Nanoarchaeota archaeon]
MAKKDEQILAQLKEYINKCISSGHEEDEIVEALLSSGWEKDIVVSAVKLVWKENYKKDHEKKPRLAHHAEDIADTQESFVTIETKIPDIIRIINDRGYAIVSDNGKPEGIITGTNILNCIDDKGKVDLEDTAADIMTSPLCYCRHDETILDVVEKMKLNGIEQLPVLKNNKYFGIITFTEIINFMSYG